MIDKIKPVYLLALGVVTITAANLNFSIDLAGWISCAPFLLYLHKTNGLKSRLLFVAGLIVSWSVCITKIVTPPMPLGMVFLYSIPISLFHMPGYLLWDKFKDHKWGTILFPAAMATMEWIQYSFTPLASWGVAAYTQMNSISIIQVVSLFGMPGLSFLVYWVNVSIAEIVVKKKTTLLTMGIPLAVTIAVIVVGALRYHVNKANGVETMKVAAVGTDSDVQGFPLPSAEINENVKRSLFDRTALASATGAKLVVWNEASTFIFPDEETSWSDSLSSLTKRLNVSLIAAFIVPTSETPADYKNKYLFFNTKGELVYTYNKHQPVPGEPALKGTEQLQVTNISGVRTGAVICYDYDFPYLAKEYGKLNADLVADPSSDWRGIDPIHTRMAAFRAVEQGHSILRSTRFGLSAAITPYGEFASQMSSFDNNDKVMMAHLPVKKVTTVYSVIGDSFVYICIALIILIIYKSYRSGSH